MVGGEGFGCADVQMSGREQPEQNEQLVHASFVQRTGRRPE